MLQFGYGYSQELDCSKYLDDSMKTTENLVFALEKQAEPAKGWRRMYKYLTIENDTLNGNYLVHIVIDEKGDKHCMKVLNSENEKLNEFILELISNIKFIPAKQGGIEIKSFLIVPVKFKKHK
jgi:hypothetical protein